MTGDHKHIKGSGYYLYFGGWGTLFQKAEAMTGDILPLPPIAGNI